ncbi:hemolysin family protein [Calothrix rhizosoleniae]|uniref:hemolysin family protein n=1 Tax=Calothrix rhizosoleniae TaxID=888997 RepID=UPI000B49D99F|nr:hemolysin family protein [Calothrix rhizosoleniae]
MSPTLEILIIFLIILGNGLFVMSELAVVSARRVRLQQLAEQGDRKAGTALKLAADPNYFLGTVQIGITLLTILSGAYGEGTIAKRIVPMLTAINLQPAYAQQLAQVIAIIIITYLTLTIGELVPKRLALNHPESIATVISQPMQLLSTISAPIVYVLSISTELILQILSIKPSSEPQVTEEEIRVLIGQGTQEGTFEAAEQDIVERVFRLGDRSLNAFMTPRLDIVWLDLEDSLEENRQKIIKNAYSRYPVCQGSLDNVVGIMSVTDLLARSFEGETLDLTVGLRQPVFIPENTHGLRVLEVFKQTLSYMALIVDEYGVIQGLVTLNDVMIEIVGELPEADEDEEPQAVQREDGSWLLDGMLPIDEFLSLFELEDLLPEEKGSYQTLGGFIITHFGRIPAAADHFERQGMRFEVMDMDGNRVDKVLVVPQPKVEPVESPVDEGKSDGVME